MILQATIYVVIIVLVCGVIFMLGPGLNTDVKLKTDHLPVSLPTDLDAYLEKQELKYSDIKPNTEKIILWAHDDKKKTKLSIVFIHGFSATRQEVSPLLEDIGKDMSANLYFTRLLGHGRSNDAMAEVTLNGLLDDVIEALEIGKKIGEKVILVGNSTGSTLITWLVATQNIEGVAGIVLLSPNYGLKHAKSKLLALPWAKYFIPLFEGDTYRFLPDNEMQKKYWTVEYPIQALFPMMALVSLTSDVKLDGIKTPLLMMYSEQDGVVDVEKIKYSYVQFGSQQKSLIVVENAQGRQSHVLAGDVLSPGTTEFVTKEIQKFIRQL